ncbi:MAG: DUF58 domain-containing protein [Desulfomonilaceae bacterium]|nr:DUF58 domain-containing protein [Desulfomonilaceae bacterium]
MRSWPFFFTARFFVLFAVASSMLIALQFFRPTGLLVPVGVDLFLLFFAVLDYFIGPSPTNIEIDRPIPYPLAVDRSNDIHLEISNTTGRPVSLIVKDDFPEKCLPRMLPIRSVVGPGSGTRLMYKLRPLERGDGEFGNIYFWLKGRLGLVWKRGSSEASCTTKLYPGLALIEQYRLRIRYPSADNPIRALRKTGEGYEFESLREFAVGDDSRLIHWKSSARKGKLILRQNRVERSQNIFLVLDAGRMMTARVSGKTKLDHSLNAALLLAYSALELGDAVGVMVVGREVQAFVPPAKTPGHFGRILDATYALPPRMEEPRFYRALSTVFTKLRRRSLIVIFTDLIDERASEGLMRYGLGLVPRHLPVVVAMSDTEVAEIADGIPETTQDLYRRGVAAEMLDRRERLLARLKSVGIPVVDTPAERMASDVLDRYLEIKTRHRL